MAQEGIPLVRSYGKVFEITLAAGQPEPFETFDNPVH